MFDFETADFAVVEDLAVLALDFFEDLVDLAALEELEILEEPDDFEAAAPDLLEELEATADFAEEFGGRLSI